MRTAIASLLLIAACHHTHVPPAAEPILTEAAIAIPIAPGKTAAWEAALHDLVGPRYAEYDSSRKRFGLTSQTTFLQQTPMGDFALIHLTGADVRASFHAMSHSQDPWDVRWRELTLGLHGMDFAQGDKVVPKIAPLYAMDSGDAAGAVPFMFLAPLAPGGAARLRAAAEALAGPRHDDYVRARARIGVRREAVFLETTALGDAAVFYWLADDPAASLRQLAASADPFDAWLRDEAAAAHPIPLAMIASIASRNVLVAQYPH
jgi:hypothetical protein